MKTYIYSLGMTLVTVIAVAFVLGFIGAMFGITDLTYKIIRNGWFRLILVTGSYELARRNIVNKTNKTNKIDGGK